MTYDHVAGRTDLEAFEAEQPDDFWAADAHLQAVLRRWVGAERLRTWEERLGRFGRECATVIDAAVRQNNLGQNLPVLDRFAAMGERCEEVLHHPSFHLAGRGIYGSGMMAALTESEGNVLSLALFYLSSQTGEAGHNCPLACTAGMIKVLRAVGGAALGERWLPRLLSRDYGTLAHAAQFLTEVQGGSDVGANAVVARPAPAGDGTFLITGEKWFCSNVTADLILVTARPEGAAPGTRGLGLFLVPRRLPDGSLNRLHIRRLKDKLGTRTLATAELDLEGAVAFPVGPLADGFKNTMTWVINTSRVFNAVGCAGLARRACLVAHGFAQHRRAFDRAIASYPMVQETLADMRSETAAMVSGTFYLVHQLDRLEAGGPRELADFVRVGLNLNKLRTALSAHEVINSGIELLGGNGTIETFSVLPRLLRDNIVFENWEGSHNVLLMQVWRDCATRQMHRGFFSHLTELARGEPRLARAVGETAAELEAAFAVDPEVATLRLRGLGSRMLWLLWAAAMAADGTDRRLLEHFLDRRLGPAAPRDRAYLDRLAAVSSAA
jgi:alkylation response protein AidB-like acyl-CoA dehydrogenase